MWGLGTYIRFGSVVITLLGTILGTLFGGMTQAYAAPPAPRWSLVVYVGSDEEELASHVDPLIENLRQAQVGEESELLIEENSANSPTVRRTIRRPGQLNQDVYLPDYDGGDPQGLAQFLAWADQNARGQNKILLVITHSWGWKGIIQDFRVPGRPSQDTMMPLRVFAQTLEASAFKPDLLFLDTCVLGNVESVDMLRNTAPYLIASQRETPYSGFPYARLFKYFKDLEPDQEDVIRRLATQITIDYPKAFGRQGEQASHEGEYDIVTAVALDMSQWESFVSLFREFVATLRENGFKTALVQNPKWPAQYWDEDTNVDVITLLNHISEFPGLDAQSRRRIQVQAQILLQQIGYPMQASDQSDEALVLDAKSVQQFNVVIQSDEITPVDGRLEKLKKRFFEANQDLRDLENLRFELQERSNKNIALLVSGELSQGTKVTFRVWLPGTRHVTVRTLGWDGHWQQTKLNRKSDSISATRFPVTSFLVAEAHSHGAPFIHGLGIQFNSLMDETEERSLDPITGLSGPAAYRATSWNLRTGWGDLIFGTRDYE